MGFFFLYTISLYLVREICRLYYEVIGHQLAFHFIFSKEC